MRGVFLFSLCARGGDSGQKKQNKGRERLNNVARVYYVQKTWVNYYDDDFFFYSQ